MKLEFNEIENSIKINDSAKRYNWGIYLLLSLNVFNSTLQFFRGLREGFDWFGYLWLSIGIFSFFILLYFIFKKSKEEIIKISEIQYVKVINVLSKKKIILSLSNGKTRELHFKSEEFDEILAFMHLHKIEVK